jgi:hypothetical protein
VLTSNGLSSIELVSYTEVVVNEVITPRYLKTRSVVLFVFNPGGITLFLLLIFTFCCNIFYSIKMNINSHQQTDVTSFVRITVTLLKQGAARSVCTICFIIFPTTKWLLPVQPSYSIWLPTRHFPHYLRPTTFAETRN